MMIQHPGRMSDLDEKIAAAAQRAKLEVITQELRAAQTSLAAIFDGIGQRRAGPAHYPDGKVVLITRAKPRTEKEG
jgi:hypothetical protein